YNPNAYSYGCGVDIHHFGKARRAATKIAKDVALLSGPVLGYIGVVDERMDYDLLAELADHDPAWNIVVVGPSAKVNPATFPQRQNLHWSGGRDYAALPSYAKKFDVCLMPFALNEATGYINPTKALEYMATGRPIVSSAIEDVVLQFDEIVSIAATSEEFIAHCEKAISDPDPARIKRGLKLAGQNSWESIVAQLEKHVEDALTTKRPIATTAA
ncbi:MAG: glycosyltransferase, partial [Chthoniobacterales bacterium]